MRFVIALVVAALSSPALAQFWDHYANARFSYEIDVPPGFLGQSESENGDGQVFYRPQTEQVLTVWGGHLLDGFEAEVTQRQRLADEESWAITYQASTPQWAVFSGQRGHRVFYQRMIPLCDGASYAAYRMEYNVHDLAETDAVIDGLTRSFAPIGC